MKFLTLFFVTIWISLASGNAFAGTFTLSDRWGGSVSNPIAIVKIIDIMIPFLA